MVICLFVNNRSILRIKQVGKFGKIKLKRYFYNVLG
nr:MAG TPA: hypothetical protein [Caudoviricetes sp.]